jgi:hypothetical protein
MLLSLQRALLGEVHPQLRQASIESSPFEKLVRVRFEYDGEPTPAVQESCSCAATEVIADAPSDWNLDEQHVARPAGTKLDPLELVAYKRWEQGADV